MSLLKTPLCPFLTSLRTRQRIGGKNLFKAASKAFKAAELLLAPPVGPLRIYKRSERLWAPPELACA